MAKDSLIDDLIREADERRKAHRAACEQLAGTPFVPVRRSELKEVCHHVMALDGMGRAEIDAWLQMDDTERNLRHEIRRHTEFGACKVIDWLRDYVRVSKEGNFRPRRPDGASG